MVLLRLTHIGQFIETKSNLQKQSKTSNAHKHNIVHVNQSIRESVFRVAIMKA